MSSFPIRYNRLTWQEMNDAIAAEPVIVLPTGSTEQHGPHLPLDVDLFICESVCLETARRRRGKALVLPPIPYGLNQHHIDFPGTIHIDPEHYIHYCLDVTRSVAHHGFQRVLIVNGHGSNTPLNEIVARKTLLETASLCATVNYISLAVPAFEEIRETATLAHADEFETSLYLHLAPERVRLERAVDGNDVHGRYMSSDSTAEFPVRFNDYWSRWTDTGVHGDPTRATAEKGAVLYEAAVGALAELVDEFREWPMQPRRDFHRRDGKEEP